MWLGSGALVALLVALSIAYLDRPSAQWAAGLDPAVVTFCRRLTALGNSAWYLVPLGLAVPALHLASRRSADAERAARLRWLLWAAVFLFAAIAASGLLTDLLKILFGRARPALLLRAGDFGWHPPGLSAKWQSFPSGHANTITAVALALGLLAPRLVTPLAVVALLVALTRIAVGDHYPSDVLAGAFVAFATTLALRAVFARRGWLFAKAARGTGEGTGPID
ncbi:MAG: phosphatase PAP2 family protein [Alphaproteobacteria bacterium]